MSKAKILIVEDELILAKDIQITLEKMGYTVLGIAPTWEKGIQKASETCPDLVLMDINLNSDIDGIEAAKQIKSRFNIPVIYLTAYADDDTLKRAKITDPFGFIIKPFEEKELRINIEMAVYKHKTEEKIRKLSRAVEQGSSTVIITDANGIIEYVNPRFTQTTGYLPEEVLGKTPSILKSGEQGPEVYVEFWRTITSGNVWRGEFHNRKKNGKLYWEQVSVSPIRNEDGVITHFVAVKEDITEQKIAQSKLKDAMEEAQRANEAKSIFLSSMSHELRTPMNSILGFAQLLESNTTESLSGSQKESVDQILKSGKHLLDLINEILDLSRIESGNFNISLEDIDVGSIITESIAAVEPMAQKHNISINNLTKDCGQYARAEHTRLKQVIMNLLSNAIKYNRVNGSVTLSYEFPEADTIRINIEDTGHGIAEEDFEKLFEPFNRLGTETLNIEGTGIGLTITRKLVEVMDGSMGVESRVGKGAKFYVDLKKAKGPLLETGKKKEVEEATYCQDTNVKHTLLYVEDNLSNLKLVENILKRRPGIELLTARQAKSGIEIARIHHPDIILMDINLPGIDGFDALKILKGYDDTKEIPIIAISANAMPMDIEKGRTAGFNDYITKPINISKFFQVIDGVLAERVPTRPNGGAGREVS